MLKTEVSTMLSLIFPIVRRFASIFGVALVLCSGVSDAASNWVLRTEWKCDEGKQDPSLEYFDSKARLMKEIENTRKTYSQGGILEYATCKPTRFTIWFESENSTGKVPQDAESVDANLGADPPSSKAGTSGSSKRGKVNRKWVMWLERLKEGQWSAVPDRRFEYLEADGITETDWQNKLKTYENAVESENKKIIQQELLRQQRGQAVAPIRYRVKWDETASAIPKAKQKNANDSSGKSADGKDNWIVGTNWGGWSQWYRDSSGDWIGFSNGAFLISFAEDGRCFVVVGDADKRTIVRTETKWRMDGEAVIVDRIGYIDNVAIMLSPHGSKATSAVALVKGEKRRVELRKDWGLKLYPPSISYTAYSWNLVEPSGNPDHRTAQPK